MRLRRRVRLLSASRSYSERSAADAARYGCSGLGLNIELSAMVPPQSFFVPLPLWLRRLVAGAGWPNCTGRLKGRVGPLPAPSCVVRLGFRSCSVGGAGGLSWSLRILSHIRIARVAPSSASLSTPLKAWPPSLPLTSSALGIALTPSRIAPLSVMPRMMSPKSRADRVIHDLRRPGRNARRDHRQQEGLHRRLDAEIPVGHELAGVVHSAVFPLNGELCSHADHQVEKEKFDRDAQRPTEVALAEAPGEPG